MRFNENGCVALFVLLGLPLLVNAWTLHPSRGRTTKSPLLSAPADTTDRVQLDNDASSMSAYSALLNNIAACLTASDLKRDRGTDGAATGGYSNVHRVVLWCWVLQLTFCRLDGLD